MQENIMIILRYLQENPTGSFFCNRQITCGFPLIFLNRIRLQSAVQIGQVGDKKAIPVNESLDSLQLFV
jgi:hypothetical protein